MPNPTPARRAAPPAGESRYVKRCHGPLCQGRVLGRSSFRQGQGTFEDVCRRCAQAQRAKPVEHTEIRRYRLAERSLVGKLAHVRMRLRELRESQ